MSNSVAVQLNSHPAAAAQKFAVRNNVINSTYMRKLKNSPLLQSYTNMPRSIVQRVLSERERKERAAFLSKIKAEGN